MQRRIVETAFAVALLIPCAAPVTATDTIASDEGLECSVCHVDTESRQLTDKGRYYEFMRSLDEYDQVLSRFGRCTYCHVSEAESLELTREGYRFRWMMEDMVGLRAWLAENHPRPADSNDEERDRDQPQTEREEEDPGS